MHKLSVPRTQLLLVRVIFIACVSVLIGNASRFAVNLLALDPVTPLRGPAREALINMHRLLQLVIDAETGERVYRVAGKPAQLEPYRLARDQYREVLDAVAVQIPDNPSQSASLLHLRTLLATRFDHEEPAIAVSDRRLLSLAGHNALIHRIQVLVDDMEGEQVRLLASRDPRSDAFVWTTLAAGFTINALVLALLALLYSMIQSSFTPRTETRAVRASPSRSAGKLGDAIGALAASELPQAI
jgi:CHASE3 domain sensor protein